MKWNTPDWWLGILTGELFGLYLALSLIDGIFQPSTDAKNWIGVSGLIGSLIVVMVRSWRFRRNKVPASTR
jgi:membrane associated rhomboid family serine protease